MLIAVADSSSSEATLRVCVVTVFARCRYGSRRARPPCRRSRGSGSWRSIRRASRRRARTAAWCSTPTSSSTTPAPSSSSCRWAALDPQLAASTPGRSADEYQPWASFPHSVTKRYNLSDLSSSSCRWSTTRGRWWRWRAARTSARTATRPTRRWRRSWAWPTCLRPTRPISSTTASSFRSLSDPPTDHRRLLYCATTTTMISPSCYSNGSDIPHRCRRTDPCSGIRLRLHATAQWPHLAVLFSGQWVGTCLSPKKCPFPRGIWTPSNSWFLGPTRASPPNVISIGSSVFAGLTVVTNTHTDHATPPVAIARICGIRVMRPNYW